MADGGKAQAVTPVFRLCTKDISAVVVPWVRGIICPCVLDAYTPGVGARAGLHWESRSVVDGSAPPSMLYC